MPGRDAALRPAREKTLRFIYYIQHELGFSHLGIADDEFGTADGLAYLPYHREGRRLDGVIRMTLDDVADRYGRPSALYRTGISVGDYPVDHHHDCRPEIGKIPFPPVPSFSVPMGVMIPAGTDNLVVSDKAISVSNLINGSTRLQPVVLLTGQAAGTLAAIAALEGCTPREVPVRRLQSALLAQNAYIAPLYDVKPDDPDFALLQRIAATGILRMTASRSSGRTARGSIPSAGSPSVSSAAACTTMRRRSKCPTTPAPLYGGVGCRHAPQGRRCRRCRRYGAPDAA